jgi:hypothetical protein
MDLAVVSAPAREANLPAKDATGPAPMILNNAAPVAPRPRSHAAAQPKPAVASPVENAPDALPSAENSVSVRLVNNKRIGLNYKLDKVGSSGVSSVDLWYTRDGRTWKKYDDGKVRVKPPFVVEVSEEGLYGFTLVARNGLGIGKAPPQTGDPPQVWVAVDWTKPRVRLLGIEQGADAKAASLVIRWSASDKNLGPRPITLSFAEQAGGPWSTIIANAENTGRYVWQLPEKIPGRVLIRVEAGDLAGNVGWAESKDPVVLDLAEPAVSIVGVDSADQ